MSDDGRDGDTRGERHGATRGSPGSGATHSELSGAAENVVQARDVRGGVHFHQAEPPDASAYVSPGAPLPRQLPGEDRHFVNRVAELRTLDAALSPAGSHSPRPSALIIAGTAGVGKTALALRWARRIAERFPDGQLYVNLRGYASDQPLTATEALHRFLLALGVPSRSLPADQEAAAALYRSCLSDRRVLLVLDNAASVRQVRPLLPGSPGCLAVVTSRNRLSGLAVRDGAQRVGLDTFAEADAVALLRTVTGDYRRGDDSSRLEEMAGLCARLPLALRIAAERAISHPHMTLDDLIGELRDESSLWHALSTGDEEDAEAVRTVFSWSYRALPRGTARIFRLLGLHPGPEFSPHAAAALAFLNVTEARQSLDSLVGAHLLEQTAPDRYQFHDLLRAYAAGQAHTLEPTEERESALRRLLTWYVGSAAAAHRRLRPHDAGLPQLPVEEGGSPVAFTDDDRAREWLERERANLNSAARASAQAGLDEFAWKLPAVLWRSGTTLLPYGEQIEVAHIALAASRRLGDREAEARILEHLGRARVNQRHFAEAEECQRQALALYSELGDRKGEATALNALGLACLRSRRLGEATALLWQARDAFSLLGEARRVAATLVNLAETSREAGRLTEAADLAQEGLTAHLDLADEQGEGRALRVLSNVRRELGEAPEALRTAQRSVDIALRLSHPLSEGFRLLTLGAAQRANGRFEDALAAHQRTAVLLRRVGDRFHEALAWHETGLTLRQLGRDEEASAFHRQAVAVFRDLGDAWHEALALESLADTLRTTAHEQARQHWSRALDLLAAYDDARAVALSCGIRDRLALLPGYPG